MFNSFATITGILIFAGAVVMLFPITVTLKIRKQLAAGKYRNTWNILLSLMLFFLGGYLLSAYFVLREREQSIYIITGVVFFAGALFVALVTRVSYLTISELGHTVEKVKRELDARLALEYERKETRENLKKNNKALLDLVKKINRSALDLGGTMQQINQYCANVLNVERASIWFFDEHKKSILCCDLYERGKDKHSSGTIIHSKDYPNYFSALEENRVIDAHNAHTDPRTSEYSIPYLTPLGISSMLDAPIWKGGHMSGILCLEHVGQSRTWTTDEQVFAASIADLISLAIETSEKTKAVKKLSAREKYLSSIYDTVGDMLFVLSVEEDRYKFSSVNKAFLNTTGLSEEDIIGKHVEEIIPKSNLNTVLSKYKEAIQEKKTVSWEQTSNYRNGTFSEEVTVAPVLDENGNCTDIVGLVHDITERKKAQEHLELKVRERTRILEENNKTLSDEIERRKQAEEQNKVYADIVKNIPVGLTIMQFEDPERPESLKIVLGNLAAEKYINVKSEDFIGKYLKDFSPDTFSSGRYKIYLEAIRTGNVIDLGIVHYPGTENIPENYFRMVAFPLPGNSVAVSMENVTELIRTEKRFQSVVEASPQALFVLGENGHIKLANKEAERLYNYSREELYQMNFTELFPEPLQNDFKEIVESHFSDSLSGKAPFRQKETKGKDKSGNEIPVELSLSLISSKAGLNLLASIMDISERVKAEEQIKVYKDIVKNIPIGLDIMKFEDPENTESLRVVTTNPAFDSFSGLKGKDIIGKYAKEVSPEIFISGKDKVYQKMLQTGKPRDFGTIHHTANGQPESYIHESAFPVSENYVAVSYENVTEQIKTEERFRLVVESAAYAILMNDKSGKIILANSKCKSLFGYRHDELIGMDVGLLVPEHNREAFIKNQVSFFEHPEERLKVGKNIEMNGLRKDGTQVALEVSSSPIYTDNKVYMLSAIADITERKEAESKLKESEARFRSIAENAPVLITRVNRDGIVEYINRVKNKFTIDDVIGHPIYEFIHPESVKIYKEKLAEAFSSGKPTSLEFRGMRDDRSMGWYSAMMAPIKTGEPISSVVVILLDITERKLADQEINFLYKNVEKNNQELEMANKELESFSYSVSHDLRAPLRAIEGYTQVVKDEYGEKFDEDGLHMITAIIGNAKKMGQLIDDLLAFSRLGKKEVQKSMIDVKAMVQTILQEIGTLSWNAQSQVDVKELLPVKGDPILIHQVFYNLIANGLKYSKNKPQPRLEIDSYRKGEFNIYCVKDNGVGFDMKYYDKLFKVFQRLHRADEFEGTGIGLAIIERIVSKHGGKVWAVSKLNEGATFFFSLPAED